MSHHNDIGAMRVRGTVRTLSRRDELPLLQDHLLRLDDQSRYNRFHGFMDDEFVSRYARKCARDGTLVVGYFSDGVLRGAAELHPPETSWESQPEIAFSVEASFRRHGIGTILFQKLIDEAQRKGYGTLRIMTGGQNDAMRALAGKFGAHLTFRHGESTGMVDLNKQPKGLWDRPAQIEPMDGARALLQLNRAYWTFFMRLYGWQQAV